LDWVLAVIAANAVALVAGVVIDGHARLFEAVHNGSSGACGTASLATTGPTTSTSSPGEPHREANSS
jgi:hypothetical protein